MQTQNAFCHLTHNDESLDLSYPGGHVYVHVGALPAVVHMVSTPGQGHPRWLSEEARLPLATKLTEIGYLRPADAL